jgi:hypothetical protein
MAAGRVGSLSGKVIPLLLLTAAVAAAYPWPIYVLTRAEIRCSGATSIPEVLDMLPGIEASEIAPGKWEVTAARFPGPLLVLIDGRGTGTGRHPAGYWDQHAVPPRDLLRIEGDSRSPEPRHAPGANAARQPPAANPSARAALRFKR